ncbi:hypothetical protein At12D13_29870 [Agrobacterium fabrum]|nr:hypothetical protein At12D13_29870 [Agrobacterium fabrum]
MSAGFCHVSEGKACPTAEMRGVALGRFLICGATGLSFLTLSLAAVSDAVAETLLWTGPDGAEWFTDAAWGRRTACRMRAMTR